MVTRYVKARKLGLFLDVTRSVRALAPALVLLVTVAGCKGFNFKRKAKPFPPAPQLVPTAAVESASPASKHAPAFVDPLSPADRAVFEQAKAQVRDLDAMAKRGVLTNPDKPEDGDAAMRCAQLEQTRARVEALPLPEAKLLAVESKRLCSFELPLISADKTLKQVTISPSQASRQLMCKYAAKDIEKARAFSASDRRVRDLDARFLRACR